MKGIKGKFLKKLKSIKPLGALKQDRVLVVKASDGLLDSSSPPHNSNGILHNSSKCRKQVQTEYTTTNCCSPPVMDHEVIDVSELMRDLEDQEMGFDDDIGDKENIGPEMIKAKGQGLALLDKDNVDSESGSYSFRSSPLTELSVSTLKQSDLEACVDSSENVEIDELGFRRPKLNSSSLFDPNLLEAFEQVAAEHMRAQEAMRRARIEEKSVENEENDEEPPPKTRRVEENPLLGFEQKCPPGGSESVVLYTTSLRGIRKTFEDCNRIIFLLESFRILFVERDISMHLEFREEMWRILGGRVVPPKLFIKGRYIGGADEVVGLHERGKLLELLEGMPRDQSTSPCDGCGGVRFLLCSNCNGSRKVRANEEENGDETSVQCPECNENGLIVCPNCC